MSVEIQTYGIALTQASRDDWAFLRQAWSDHYILTDRLALIRGPQATPQEVADLLGINEQQQIEGLVINLDEGGLVGYHQRHVWIWLKRKPNPNP